MYAAENVLFEEKEKIGNYWLAGVGKKGPEAVFSLDLKQYKNVTGFKIKNTKNETKRDQGTKKFTIYSEDKILMSEELDDIQNMKDEVPTVSFSLDPPQLIRYLKFQIDSFYGTGGGLQYFSVIGICIQIIKFHIRRTYRF